MAEQLQLLQEVAQGAPPIPKPMYRLTGNGGAICRLCQHRIRKVCAVAYYAHGRSLKHQRALAAARRRASAEVA